MKPALPLSTDLGRLQPRAQRHPLLRPGLLFFALVTAGLLSAQTYNLSNGSTSTCAGTLYDSGGSGASYGNNQDITFTICPDQPGAAIQLDFTLFNLGSGDQLIIYDGDSDAAGDLGTYIATDLNGSVVSASPLNSTGCITLVFLSDNVGTGNFAAAIACYLPCVRPTAAAVMGESSPAQICPGETVSFDASGSYAEAGFTIAQWVWDFGDGQTGTGQTTSHTYALPGAYVVGMHVVDDNGCASTNPVDLLVLVGTEPTFGGTGGTLEGCPGGTMCLTGAVEGTTWGALPESNLGAGVALPDGSGVCYTTSLTYTQFAPGQTFSSASDLQSICISLEHSYMGDLIISLIGPSGQSVTMHSQGGAGTYLGVPIDVEGSSAQGTCWDYCWSPTATNGTWAANAGGTLPSGTYASVNPFSGLIGTSLNGTWTLQVCDQLLLDNGFICDWEINFAPSLFPDLIEFTPVYGSDIDSSYWSGPDITSLSPDGNNVCVSPPTPGAYDYVYTVTDNFGCTYDTTVTVTVIPGPVVDAGPDQVTCGTPVPLGASMVSGGLPGDCVYQLQLLDSWGDGWNGGANITVTIDGVSSNYTLPNGTQSTINLPVTHGDQITLTFQAGTIWNGENSFRLRNSAGAIVYSSPAGPPSGVAWSGTAVCPPEPFVFVWDPPAGLSNPNVANPTATVASTTTYCVTAYQPSYPECPATDCMTITVDTGIDAGTGSSLTLCQDGPVTDLFTLLGGTPDAGGAWTTPSGTPHSGLLQPGTDPPGAYTYTVTGSGACGAATASAQVQVTLNALPDPGTDGVLTVCNTGGVQGLIGSLGGAPQAGGTWTDPAGNAHSGAFDPATDPTGIYTYTVAGTAPCPSAQAIVSVQMNVQPDAGTDGALTVCPVSGGPFALFDVLGGTPGPSGTWTDPVGASHSGSLDPTTAIDGGYTYTIAGAAPCSNATAQVIVDVAQPAEPGLDGALTLCITGQVADLFTAIGGTPDPTGMWEDPSGAPHNGQFQPGVDAPGAYSYTVQGEAPCPTGSSSVTVAVAQEPDAGADGSMTLCSSGAAVDLFNALEGTPEAGGTWTTPAGGPFSGVFDPAMNAAGDYTYQVTAPPPCISASAVVTITLVAPADPGADASTTVCAASGTLDLYPELGGTPEPGGTWMTATGEPFDGVFDPAIHVAGDYTYTVTSTAPCPAMSAAVTVTLATPADAGADGNLTLCNTTTLTDLADHLSGADPGGSWSDPSGNVFTGTFDPAVHQPGAYLYTVAGIQPCPSDQATLTVQVVETANAGTDAAVALCSTSPAVVLFDALNGTPDAGGQWQTPSGTPFGGVFTPGTHPVGAYSYVQTAPAPCANDTAFITITVANHPDAGSDVQLSLCATAAAVDLLDALGGMPDAGGSWSGPAGGSNGTFVPGTNAPGVYTYTLTGIAPCPNESSMVTIAVDEPVSAGSNGSVALCPEAAPVDLFGQLGGTPDAGGSWTGPGGIASNGTYDPATQPYGNYIYTVAGGSACPDATATVVVTIHAVAQPNAGPDAVSCTLGFTLGATGTWASGAWSGPSGPIINAPTSPSSAVAAPVSGTHTFVWSTISNDGCLASDEVTVTFTEPMTLSTAPTDASCHAQCNGTAIATATGGITGAQGYVYIWSGAGTQTGPTVTGLCAGSYTVQATDMNGCSVQMAFTISQPLPVLAEVITATSVTCYGDCDGTVAVVGPPGAMFALAGSTTFQAEGLFTDLCAGNHPIIVQDTAGCEGSITADVPGPPPVEAFFVAGPDTAFVSSPLVHFLNQSSPGTNSFHWDFAGLGESTATHPSFTFPGHLGDMYLVCLTAWDAHGCEGRYCAPVHVLDELEVFVPNAFTPDGDDINETFLPTFNVSWVEDYEFMIFDRWGELIFRSTEPGEGWRGDRNGSVVQEGVYVWRMQCRDRYSGNGITRTGHVTLLR